MRTRARLLASLAAALAVSGPAAASEVPAAAAAQPRATLAGSFPASLAFGGERSVAVLGHDGSVTLWSTTEGAATRTWRAHTRAASALAFSSDGSRLVTVGWDSGPDPAIRLWDVGSGRQLGVIDGEGAHDVSDLAVSASGKHVAAGYRDGSLRLLAFASDRRQVLEPPGEEPAVDYALAIHPDGRQLAAANSIGNVVSLWDLATGEERLRLAARRPDIRSLAFSPDGRWLAAGGFDAGGYGPRRHSPVEIFDLASRSSVATLEGPRHATWHLAFTADGRSLVALGGAAADREAEVVAWAFASHRQEWSVRLPGRALGLSGDGSLAAAQQSLDPVSLWEAVPASVLQAAAPIPAAASPPGAARPAQAPPRAGAAPSTTSTARAAPMTSTGPGPNRPPVIAPTSQVSTQFAYDAAGRLVAALTTLSIEATDPDGDSLTYRWECTIGRIGGSGATVSWNRPIEYGRPAPGRATVFVDDGHGGGVAHTFDLQ